MTSCELQKIYDQFAQTYDTNRNLFDMTDVIDDFCKRLSPAPGHLLDLGCGAGEPFSAHFIRQGWHVTGVDLSQKMLALANKYVPAMKTILSDICDVDFADHQFDAVISIYCLFHIDHKQHENLFKNIYHWLKPGGKLLFTYASREYTGSDIFSGYKEFRGQQLFYSHTNPENITAMLNSIGFVIESAVYRQIGGETFLWVTVAKP
jgi:cyclopropane fatty-acyl-phospholipid synthase-like methyltransferase